MQPSKPLVDFSFAGRLNRFKSTVDDYAKHIAHWAGEPVVLSDLINVDVTRRGGLTFFRIGRLKGSFTIQSAEKAGEPCTVDFDKPRMAKRYKTFVKP